MSIRTWAADYFYSWHVHYDCGFAYGVALRLVPARVARRRIKALYEWGWTRECRQHPDQHGLTPHQVKEARAWGDGASAGRGIAPEPPSPPYEPVNS